MCAGEQTCTSDGTGYSPCSCDGTGNGGSAGAAGSGNVGGSSNGGAAGAGVAPGDALFPAADRAVGAPCTTDAECPTGPNGETPLICITASSTAQFGGGPQGGYCTAVCSDTEECQALDGLSACGLYDNATQSGYCIALCVPGTSNVKCFADRAQACFESEANPGLGACFPVCQSDTACGPGLFCDLGAQGLGVCTAAPPVGGDVGAPCTPETELTDCKSGLCIELANDAGEVSGRLCSANCTFGLIQGCGYDRVTSERRDALCGQAQTENGDVGDVGFCFELCDTAADCTQAGWECVVNLSPEGQAAVGRLGQCLPPLAGADAGAP
jgi:hypothetical protein